MQAFEFLISEELTENENLREGSRTKVHGDDQRHRETEKGGKTLV